MNSFYLNKKGYCPICEGGAEFQANEAWLRDHFLCQSCGSIPRERALMLVLNQCAPNWKEMLIHESSPGGRGVSIKLHAECTGYSASQFYPNVDEGEIHASGYQCQNLERLTFEDDSFDIIITQDVMEHIFNPAEAFKEIGRVLKPKGVHIFTVPIVNKAEKTEFRAVIDSDSKEIRYLKSAEYHGNPVDAKGALVTTDWGYDIADFIVEASGMPTTIIALDDMYMGIRAEYIDVLVSRKHKTY